MSKPTYLVVLTDENSRQIDAIVRTVHEISAPTDARVVVAHVLTEQTYQRALGELDDEPKTALERRFVEQVPTHPGTEDDVPEWVKRWSQRRVRGPRESEELPESDAIERILDRKDAIQRMAEGLDAAGIEYEVRGAIGDPVDRFMRMIEEADADFVVVSAREWPNVRQALFSDVAQKILRSASSPVLSVRETVYE